MNKPKIYGITFVPRRLYNLLLATLLAIIINTFCINTLAINKMDAKLDDKYGSQNIECVVDAIAGEAIGEPIEGQKAIIEVIANRASSKDFPNTFCEVVHQNKQFSYLQGNGNYKYIYKHPKKVYELTKMVYQHLYEIEKSEKKRVIPACVTHFDGTAFKKPSWSYNMDMVKEISGHQFYCRKINNDKK